ncbi:MAG: DUF3179 domain-containing protein [Leptolyngbya sp. SIO1E4]|nr:DUF3179 domain-containing protein [Leptolyngbya sp. SIO1E4]
MDMISTVFAIAALLVAVVISLGRPITVFMVFEPGLWLFRRFPLKRSIGLLFVAIFATTALSNEPSRVVVLIVSIAGVLSAFAIFFNLDWLFPALPGICAVPVSVTEDEATTHARLSDNQLVVTVELNHERRAYPLDQMVIPRHLVHDWVGGEPIVVTYCALCRTGLVFHAKMASKALLFKVVGVFRRNLIMEDHSTHTIWQQATGEAIHGPLSGRVLEMLPAVQIPWEQAKQQDGMTLATEPDNARFAIFATHKGFSLLKKATEMIMTPGRTHLSKTISRHETVFGIQLNGEAKAYPLSSVRSLGTFFDTVGGIELELEFNEATEVLNVRRCDGAAPPVVEQHWWLGWNEFHPDTQLYAPRSVR